MIFEKNIFKVFLYLYLFFYPKTSNFHNSGMIGCRKLSGPSMNNIVNVLSIGLQYTLSFKWHDFGLRYLVTITPKGYPLKFKASVWNIAIPISETSRNCNSLFKLVDGKRVVTEKKDGVQLGMYFSSQSGFQQVSGFLRLE